MALLRSAVVALAALGVATAAPADASLCDGSPELRLSVDAASGLAALSNGFVCIVLAPGALTVAAADFDGAGNYGANTLAAGGVTLQRIMADGASVLDS